MTSWNSAIPQPLNVPANDAVAMQKNFAVLDTAFAVDHTPLKDSQNQGMHQQITFPQPPPNIPLPVNAQQSYEYERMLATNVRSYLEYQPSGPDVFPSPGPAAFVPLSFKAYAIIDPLTGVVGPLPFTYPPANYFRRFNIQMIQVNAIGPIFYTITVTFNEAMPDGEYFVTTFLRSNNPPNPPTVTVVAQTATNFTVRLITFASAARLGFGVW